MKHLKNLAALAAVIGLFAGATRLCLEQRVLCLPDLQRLRPSMPLRCLDIPEWRQEGQ